MVSWAALNTEPRSPTAEGGCSHMGISPGEQLLSLRPLATLARLPLTRVPWPCYRQMFALVTENPYARYQISRR
jgi:hypothetical protein